MQSLSYATRCAIFCGLANLVVWTGFNASAFISESILHSMNKRDPEKNNHYFGLKTLLGAILIIGAHDGFYGLAVTNAFYTLTTLIVPSLMEYLRSKWILTLSGAFFTMYFLSFLVLNRLLYFAATFNVGFSGYITEFSTRTTIERNTALSWTVTSCSVLGAGAVNLFVTALNKNEVASKYREYSDTELTYFYAAFSALGVIGLALYAFLPNQEVDGNIAASNERCKTIKEHLSVMLNVLFHKRVLILAPFYLYIGLYFSFWLSVLPTSLLFTKSLSHNVYLPAYFGISFTIGSIFMSLLIMKMSTYMKNFCLKPLMIILVVSHGPSTFSVLILAFLCGIGDVCNNSTRTVLSSLIIPTRKQQTFGVSRFFHGLSATILFVVSTYLSIYSYVIILSIFLLAATITYLYSCGIVIKDEEVPTKTLNNTD